MTDRLYQKYSVVKNTWPPGVYLPDHDHQYFVLAPRTDQHARNALRHYALSCGTQCPQLAKEILEWITAIEEVDKAVG